MLELQEMQIMF